MKRSLAANIAAARRHRFLTQQQLADALGVTGRAVQAWEGAESSPRLPLIPQIAEVLGVTPEWLIADHDADPVTA